MKNSQVTIIGGGLAGLTAAIHLCKNGIGTILFEKEVYPHHKVCGEYLSGEILPYLESLSVDVFRLNPPEINQMEFSSRNGQRIHAEMELGGIGISRYNLDNLLFEEAKNAGCEIIRNSVTEIEYSKGKFNIKTAGTDVLTSEFVIGAFGKRSNLDKFLKRNFIQEKSGWLGVKGHYKVPASYYPENLVSLHNFDGGYCGLSQTEMGTINVCYLATYESFKRFKNIEEFKNEVLMSNSRLKEFFEVAEPVFEKDLSIAQISFDKKSIVDHHILMLGDSAGLIHPLCGNGMAMAIHSAKIASENILKFYSDSEITRSDVENLYISEWNQNFRDRIRTGRILQKILLNQKLAGLSQNLIKSFPGILPQIIKRTHGKKVHV